MVVEPSEEQLVAAHCWERDDRVPGRPAMTAFRRATRYHHARWREAHGHPIGTQPYAPRPDSRSVRLVGSRLPFEYACETGANFVTPAALDAARRRTSFVEPHQSFDHQRLWADLLSSEALAFNLFGDVASDLDAADRAVHAWWPDVPGTVAEVRFAHSPGRFDPAYLNSLRSFAAAFVTDVADGTRGIVAVDVRYHERNKAEIPRPENVTRYVEVAERSRAFAPGAVDVLKERSDLCVMWLEHLLVLSMLQHASGSWSWGRYVVVHPSGNSDVDDACDRYRSMLADQSTFATMTLEQLLDSRELSRPAITALRARYLPAERPGSPGASAERSVSSAVHRS